MKNSFVTGEMPARNRATYSAILMAANAAPQSTAIASRVANFIFSDCIRAELQREPLGDPLKILVCGNLPRDTGVELCLVEKLSFYCCQHLSESLFDVPFGKGYVLYAS